MNTIQPEKEIENIVIRIKEKFAQANFSKAIVGVSGGIDSAVVLSLTVRAMGAENVIPMFLPYSTLGTSGVLDSMELVQKLGIPLKNIVRVDIKPMVDTIVRTDPFMDNVRKGNIMARVRMILLFDEAKKRKGLVVGTENKSEHLLGYFTRFGDEASDVEPIIHLYKTQVYVLGKVLDVPEKIISKSPSADLWPEQTDEKELGFLYKDADEILYQLYDEKKMVEEIVQSGLSKEVVLLVKKRVEENEFKRMVK